MQKSMQMHAQNITQYVCAHTIQNAEMKQAKKTVTLILQLIMQKS